MLRPPITALALSAAAILSLSACSTPGASVDAPTSTAATPSDEPAAAATGRDCLVDREWSLDTEYFAEQFSAKMAENGANIDSAHADGEQTLTVEDAGDATLDTDMTLTLEFTVPDGPTVVMTQEHVGVISGEWAWDEGASSFAPADWDDSGYSIDTSFTVDGTEVELPIEMPDDVFGSTTLIVDCEGDVLTTTEQSIDLSYRWTAN